MKKTASFFLVLISLCALLLCCLLSASAVGETITLLPLKVGEIDYRQTRSFQFNVPALSEVELYFFGYYEDEDEYEEYETEGDVKIQIKDSDKDVVYYEEARFSGRSLSCIVTLEKGDYTLLLSENSSSYHNKDYGNNNKDDNKDYNKDYDEEDDEWYDDECCDDDWCNDDWYYDDWYDEETFEYCFYVSAVLLEDIQPTYLALNKTQANLSVGKNLSLVGEYAPASVTVKPVWSTSNKKIAVVDDYGNVTAKAFGKAKITLKLGKKTVSCVVNVNSNKKSVDIFLGKTASIQNRFAYVYGYEKAKWSSSDKKIATVNQSGVVTGKATGNATITATIKGVKYTQKVTVKEPSVKLNKTKATIYKGDYSAVASSSVTLKATTDPANKPITWTSSNTKVAKVSQKGKVTAVAPGTATIKASFSYEGKTYSNSCTITVKTKKAITAKVAYISDVDVYNDCYIEFQNNTNKAVTYIRLNIKQYDNRGYRLSSPYEYYYLNETIKENSKGTYYFWVNNDTKSAKVTITKVWFSDGSTYTPR